jgi:molybdopterin-containing oxidoreductase family membrane subunit
LKKDIKETYEESLLRPIYYTSKVFYVALVVLLGIIGWFGYAWWTQLTEGLWVTGMRDLGVMAGSPWGIYIASFIWYVGIAHGGIAISAAIRIMKLEQYRPIARIAEVITVVTLLMAAFNIIFDIGRPDRVFNMILYYWERVGHSPLIWDLTVIIGYFVLSVTYLTITMREDMAHLKERQPLLGKLRRFLYSGALLGYDRREKEKVEQIAWWLALCLIVLMALLSGGVIPWLFGLMVSQPGWFGAVQGPYFLTAALASALAGVILVAAIMRRLFGWHNEIKTDIFKGLSKILAVFVIIYLWFVLHEQITIQYGGPLPERAISEALLFGRLAPAYWAVILGLIATFIYLALQAIKPSLFSLKGTVVASAIVLAVLWVKRFLIVIPSLLYPRLPYPVGSYTPTWVEWSLFVGTLAIATLIYMLFVKLYPIMEIRREVK